MAVFKEAQQLVGLAEGGYQKDPRDKGNYYQGKLVGTNWGISAPVLAKYLQRTPTVADMQSLKRATAEEILRINYWLKNNLDKIKNQSVANLLYDGVVNQGSNGTRFLVEKALRYLKKPMSYYKVFTELGIEFLNKLNQEKLFNKIKDVRLDKYKKSKDHFAFRSWVNRLKKIVYSSDSSKAYSKGEIESMQATLLEMASENCNHNIIDFIMSTGGVDGFIGKGFRSALNEAIDHSYVLDLKDLFNKAN